MRTSRQLPSKIAHEFSIVSFSKIFGGLSARITADPKEGCLLMSMNTVLETLSAIMTQLRPGAKLDDLTACGASKKLYCAGTQLSVKRPN